MRDYDPICDSLIMPYDWNTARIVIGYNDEIRLMVCTDKTVWAPKKVKELQYCKIKYLEHFLGYKIEKMENIMSHDEYEKALEKNCENNDMFDVNIQRISSDGLIEFTCKINTDNKVVDCPFGTIRLTEKQADELASKFFEDSMVPT